VARLSAVVTAVEMEVPVVELEVVRLPAAEELAPVS